MIFCFVEILHFRICVNRKRTKNSEQEHPKDDDDDPAAIKAGSAPHDAGSEDQEPRTKDTAAATSRDASSH